MYTNQANYVEDTPTVLVIQNGLSVHNQPTKIIMTNVFSKHTM